MQNPIYYLTSCYCSNAHFCNSSKLQQIVLFTLPFFRFNYVNCNDFVSRFLLYEKLFMYHNSLNCSECQGIFVKNKFVKISLFSLYICFHWIKSIRWWFSFTAYLPTAFNKCPFSIVLSVFVSIFYARMSALWISPPWNKFSL